MKLVKNQIALVTGGAGFIGSHLCDRLIADGARVIGLDNFLTGRFQNVAHLVEDPRFELIERDVIDDVPQSLHRARLTHIYHLASPASPRQYQADPEHTLLTNTLGTRNVLRLAEANGARFLLTSTSEVYGEPEVHPQHEDYRGSVNCTGPRACYDEGKRAAEALTFDFLRAGRCEARVARIFNTYGPRLRADDGRVVSNVVCQAIAGEDITIYGDGAQTRSFCYVDDTVEALLRLMNCEAASGLPVNVGNPEEVSVSKLVSVITRLSGSRSRIIHLPLPTDDPQRRKPDVSRARQLLDWQPRVSLETGLRAVIDWFAKERETRVDASERTLAAAE